MPKTEQGVSIVFSAPQLAAVLADDTISEDATFTNRLWGGLRTVGGVVEMLGAGALCLAPEPSMTTKVGCVVVGAHSIDTITTGINEVRTGISGKSLTEKGASAAAKAMGASPSAAGIVALAVDIAVPLSFAGLIGATRIAAIRAGRIRLIEHEAAAGSRLGGHTILKHVGKTEAELRARLVRDAHVKVASTFSSLNVAERVISKAMRVNSSKIKIWAQRGAQSGRVPPLDFELAVRSEIGYGVVRATGLLVKMKKVKVVLKYQLYNGNPYFVLTAYPIP